jgi:hypothetical protein
VILCLFLLKRQEWLWAETGCCCQPETSCVAVVPGPKLKDSCEAATLFRGCAGKTFNLGSEAGLKLSSLRTKNEARPMASALLRGTRGLHRDCDDCDKASQAAHEFLKRMCFFPPTWLSCISWDLLTNLNSPALCFSLMQANIISNCPHRRL